MRGLRRCQRSSPCMWGSMLGGSAELANVSVPPPLPWAKASVRALAAATTATALPFRNRRRSTVTPLELRSRRLPMIGSPLACTAEHRTRHAAMAAVLVRFVERTGPGAAWAHRGAIVLLLQEPHLPQHGGVVPVDPFTRDLVTTELYDHHDVHGELLAGGRKVRQQPRHRPAVSEGDTELVHELAHPDDAVDGGHLQVVGPGGDEVVPVKGPQRGLPPAAGVHRHVVDVGVLDHGGERRLDVLGRELPLEMLGPELLELSRRESRRSRVMLGHRALLSMRPSPRPSCGRSGAGDNPFVHRQITREVERQKMTSWRDRSWVRNSRTAVTATGAASSMEHPMDPCMPKVRRVVVTTSASRSTITWAVTAGNAARTDGTGTAA